MYSCVFNSHLQAGTLHIMPGEEVIGEYLARGWITQDGLDEARRRYGVPTRNQG